MVPNWFLDRFWSTHFWSGAKQRFCFTGCRSVCKQLLMLPFHLKQETPLAATHNHLYPKVDHMVAIAIQIWEFLNNFISSVHSAAHCKQRQGQGHGDKTTIVDVALPLYNKELLFLPQRPIPKGWSYGCHRHPNTNDSLWTILLALCTVRHTANNNKDVFRGHGHTKTCVKTTIVDVAL